jgi:hypothetical protein
MPPQRQQHHSKGVSEKASPSHRLPMKTALLRVALILATILVGIMLYILLSSNPSALPAVEYLSRQQAMIRLLNVPMPILGAVTIALTVTCAGLYRSQRRICGPLIAAAILLIVSGITTRFFNQPINAQVMTWHADAMPANWMALRDGWWKFHIFRTLMGVGALLKLITASIRRFEGRQPESAAVVPSVS